MMSKNKDNRNNSFLRLVVDSGRYLDQVNDELECNISEGGPQFEMFGSADSVLYTEVRKLCFNNIKSLIHQYHIHHILDLREVPYLNFGNSNRDVFFQYLSSNSVAYLSFVSVASQKKKTSISELFKDDSTSNILVDELIDWIGKGPTLIFINVEREKDYLAKNFSKLLEKSDISFSEIIAK